MPQLVAVSKAKYTRLRNINVDGQKNTLYPGKLNKIIPPPENKRLRASVSLMARYSTRLFPAFRFMAKEFVTTEWLSFVDIHKKPENWTIGLTLQALKEDFGCPIVLIWLRS
ncbi:MAG TPA: hypothetical protein VK186_08685 [Candidatus Deferrimicrobium sp.]|nr:hypothetical protein [Candidatus Deferrimicrobium sp.]